jgi:hypothetical protein
VAIADPQRELAEAAARTFGIPHVYDSHEALIGRDDLDLVDVCTPSHTHFALSWAALEAGHHVLCEKPVAFDFPRHQAGGGVRARQGPQDQTGLHVPLRAGDALFSQAGGRRLRRHAVHLQRLRAELAVAQSHDSAAPGRSGYRPAMLHVSSLEGYGAPIIDISH